MNRKSVLFLLVLGLIVFAMAGCTQSAETPEEPAVETPVEEPTAVVLEEKVVIYSTHSEELLELVADAFEEKTGVTVEYINLKGELAERVEAEKNNPQADDIIGGASNLYMELKNKNL